jgi:hypothetical protein
MAKPLNPDTLVVETYAPGPEDSIESAYCTGCVSTCGILPP